MFNVNLYVKFCYRSEVILAVFSLLRLCVFLAVYVQEQTSLTYNFWACRSALVFVRTLYEVVRC